MDGMDLMDDMDKLTMSHDVSKAKWSIVSTEAMKSINKRGRAPERR